MNPRTCVVQALDHEEPELLPYSFAIDEQVRDGIDREMGGTRWRDSLIYFHHGVGFPLPNRRTQPDGKYVDAYGSAWEQGNIMHLLEPALPEPTLKGFTWPDVDALWAQHHEQLAQSLAARPQRYRTAGLSFGLFERSWTLRGFTGVLMDMAAEPAFCEELFDAIMDHQMRIVSYLLTLDIDAIWFSDDWGQQRGLIMGPDHWRRYIKPRKARMIAQVHQAGKKAILHCCGSVTEIMPDIIAIGLDCLQSLQPEAMDVFALKHLYGRDIALWGGGPSQSLIPFGTPGRIREHFRRLRDELSAGGGYICGPAKAIMTDTSVPNAIATIEGIIGHALQRG